MPVSRLNTKIFHDIRSLVTVTFVFLNLSAECISFCRNYGANSCLYWVKRSLETQGSFLHVSCCRNSGYAFLIFLSQSLFALSWTRYTWIVNFCLRDATTWPDLFLDWNTYERIFVFLATQAFVYQLAEFYPDIVSSSHLQKFLSKDFSCNYESTISTKSASFPPRKQTQL